MVAAQVLQPAVELVLSREGALAVAWGQELPQELALGLEQVAV